MERFYARAGVRSARSDWAGLAALWVADLALGQNSYAAHSTCATYVICVMLISVLVC